MELFSLQDLFLHDLRDLHSAERQIAAALPRIRQAAGTDALQAALSDCLADANSHRGRLEEIFAQFDESPDGKECHAIAALLEANQTLVRRPAEPAVMDAALIGAMQRMLHYKMAGYGCLRTYAALLRLDVAARELEAMLTGEKRADERLNEIAGQINLEARDPAL